jgi:hypothetical protein
VGAELGQQGGIGHVSLASGQVLDVSGIDQHHLEGAVLQQVEEGLPVIAGCLHHHQRHLFGDQVVAEGEDLVGHRAPGGDGRFRLGTSFTGNPDAHLGVPLRHIDPRAPGMDNIHGHHSLSSWLDVRSGEGRENRKSDARAQRQQSTVPVGSPPPPCSDTGSNGTREGSASYRGGRNQLDRRPGSRSRGPRVVGSDGQPRRHNLRSPRRAQSGSVLLRSEVPSTRTRPCRLPRLTRISRRYRPPKLVASTGELVPPHTWNPRHQERSPTVTELHVSTADISGQCPSEAVTAI